MKNHFIILSIVALTGCSFVKDYEQSGSDSHASPLTPMSNEEISSFSCAEADTNTPAPTPTNVIISCSTAPWTLQASSGLALPFVSITNVNGNFVTVPLDADDRQFRAAVFASSHLTWNAITNLNAAGYNIYFGTDVDDFDSKWNVNNGSANNTEVLGLQWNTAYYFVAESYDTNGDESGESTIATFTTPNAPPQPVVHINE